MSDEKLAEIARAEFLLGTIRPAHAEVSEAERLRADVARLTRERDETHIDRAALTAANGHDTAWIEALAARLGVGQPWCPNINEAVERLMLERNEALENYQFMVDRAINEKLDGYRELGRKAADAENALDREREAHAQTRAERKGDQERLADAARDIIRMDVETKELERLREADGKACFATYQMLNEKREECGRLAVKLADAKRQIADLSTPASVGFALANQRSAHAKAVTEMNRAIAEAEVAGHDADELQRQRDALAAVLAGIEVYLAHEDGVEDWDTALVVDVLAKLAALKREHGIGGA